MASRDDPRPATDPSPGSRAQASAPRRTAIWAAAATLLVVVAGGVTFAVVQSSGSGGKPAAVQTTLTSQAPTAPAASQSPLPTRQPAAITRRTVRRTNGPCGYAESLSALTSGTRFDVGLPPDPSSQDHGAYTVDIATNLGPIIVSLDASTAPCNVQSLLFLIRQGFYNHTGCPRAVNGGIFIVQCGDPTGTGEGGPTYTVKDEGLSGAVYSAGAVVMANSGPNTNGSQFFFAVQAFPAGYPKAYTVVGHVLSGMPILQRVVSSGNNGSSGSAGGGRPNLNLVFNAVTVK